MHAFLHGCVEGMKNGVLEFIKKGWGNRIYLPSKMT